MKKENFNLKSILEKLKNRFYFVKHFIMDKIMRSNEKEKYIELTQNLYEHKAFDNDDYQELMSFSNPINDSKNYIVKEKDNYE